MSNLIVVSNREPYEHNSVDGRVVCQRTDGGLVSALDPVLKHLGGTWIAWGSGGADQEVPGQVDGLPMPPDEPAYRLRRVWLEPAAVRNGGQGYANQVLWPLCHVTLDRVSYRKAFWAGYEALNRSFADTVLDELGKRPAPVWVHDYHLGLLPAMIKQQSPDTTICLFWHVPWPGPDVFRILPERREMLEGLLAADCLTFQTASYATAFADCAKEFLNASVDPSKTVVHHRGHKTRLTIRAISVHFNRFSDLAKTAEVEDVMARARRRLGIPRGVRIGLGVDRLDYTKGLMKRLWALEDFFDRYPEYLGTFTFLQVAIPTRNNVEAYRQYRDLIRETVTEINERFKAPPEGTNKGWTPIEYIEGRVTSHTLVAYYRMADLTLVSSVYDGMNLVAKEYVASQVDETGVLVVSHLAGAAEELMGALVVNPYDQEGMADSIRRALEMPENERRERMQLMRLRLSTHDIFHWAESCLRDADIEVDRLESVQG
ncbi:MAG: trehalose-6-phosphate synthase [Nitrospirae bacterium]|nr:trehalose-6-phosphate synthase [Nitrospirota bacterium]